MQELQLTEAETGWDHAANHLSTGAVVRIPMDNLSSF